MPVHHLDFEANTILVDGLTAATTAVDSAARHRGMAAIYGIPGVGKSFSVATALELGTGLEPIEIEPFNPFSVKTLAVALAERLRPGSGQGTLRELDQLLLTQLLPGREFLLVIDEAQRLGQETFEYARHLWDARQKARALAGDTAFAVVFVGGHGCFETLYSHPMLRERISWWVEIHPLDEETVLAKIPQLNPLLHECAPETLLRINDEYAHGRLRSWVDFLAKAQDHCQTTNKTTIDDQVVDAIFPTRAALARAA